MYRMNMNYLLCTGMLEAGVQGGGQAALPGPPRPFKLPFARHLPAIWPTQPLGMFRLSGSLGNPGHPAVWLVRQPVESG